MSIQFSQDREQLTLQFTVLDAHGNALTPVGPQFSVSDTSLLEIQANTPSTVTLTHPNRNNSGIATVTYSVIGGDGERINRSEEIHVVFGNPASIVVSEIG